MLELKYEVSKRENPVQIPDELIFGKVFTDHALEMDYDPEKGGWYSAVIKKNEEIKISAAAMVFHYGQAIFEGLKAYNRADGTISLFRPDKNFERMNSSAERMCMPVLDIPFVLNALKELIKVDRDWIPTKPGHSLYIRPVMFATEPCVGVRASATYKLVVILSPVGPYYASGFKPVPIYVSENYVRAVRKGVGFAKTAGNYAASLAGQAEAKKLGYSQVLWLDGIEQKFIEEVGAMNIFIRFKDEVATPMLTGSILPGVTRMSAIQILKDWGYTVNERMIGIEEIISKYKVGELLEVYGTGTAAVISAVSKLQYRNEIVQLQEDVAGELSQKLYDELVGIQTGKIADRYNWNVII